MKSLKKYMRNRKFKDGRKSPYVDEKLVSCFPKKGRFTFKGSIYSYSDVEFVESQKGGYPIAKGIEKFTITENAMSHSEPTKEELEELNTAMRNGFLLNLQE